MKRSPKAFVWFTNKLQELGYLNELEIEKALSSLAGVKGVVSDEFYISGYEELGWFLSNKLSLIQLKTFALENRDLLSDDRGDRYFFVQALVDQPKFTFSDRIDLIESMPERLQIFLKRRFINPEL